MEHEGTLAQLHATEVQPRTHDHRDMAGGKDLGDIYVKAEGAEIQSLDAEGREIPTEEELQTLTKVADKLPMAIFLVAAIELCERFAYYGLQGPFQNYIQNSVNDPSGLPGAIGLGQTGATGLNNFFQFWCYVTPIGGAIIADSYLGRYKTILYSALVYIAGLIILWTTALPGSIANGAALGGLITAMIVIGLGTGGIKSNVSTLIAEQYDTVTPYIQTQKDGTRVIIDPAVTVQRIYMIFYLCINIGSLSPIATVYMEADIGFWSAYLLCNCMFLVGFAVLLFGKKQYKVRPPRGSVIPNAFRVCFTALKHGRTFEAAKPAYRQAHGLKQVPWDDQFVNEVSRAIAACSVFSFFGVYWVCYQQMTTNLISQAGEMDLHGIPNDLMQNWDPITLIIFIPIFDRLIYPALRRAGIPFKPISRITLGFIFGGIAMAYAAGTQKLIYNAGPCYDAPLNCDAGTLPDGTVLPNNVHVAIQAPAYFFIGISEIFASITGLEYAFTKGPTTMKSFIMSIFLFQSAIGSALSAALSPTAEDPEVLWMYTGIAVAAVIAGGIFYLCFRRLNDAEESLNALDQTGEKIMTVDEAQHQPRDTARSTSVDVDQKV